MTLEQLEHITTDLRVIGSADAPTAGMLGISADLQRLAADFAEAAAAPAASAPADEDRLVRAASRAAALGWVRTAPTYARIGNQADSGSEGDIALELRKLFDRQVAQPAGVLGRGIVVVLVHVLARLPETSELRAATTNGPFVTFLSGSRVGDVAWLSRVFAEQAEREVVSDVIAYQPELLEEVERGSPRMRPLRSWASREGLAWLDPSLAG